MIALFRYALLKSRRDNLLASLLAGPAVLIAAPILGMSGLALLKGRFVYPFVSTPKMSVAATAQVLGTFGMIIATIGAGIGAFWVFRTEAANRSLGSFMLAARARTIVGTAVMFGFLAGLASFAIVLLCIALATTQLPPNTTELIPHLIGAAAITAALGATLMAVSPEISMAVPLYLASLFVGGTLGNTEHKAATAISLTAAAILVLTASFLLERRCKI